MYQPGLAFLIAQPDIWRYEFGREIDDGRPVTIVTGNLKRREVKWRGGINRATTDNRVDAGDSTGCA